jgi:hypothetical protein
MVRLRNIQRFILYSKNTHYKAVKKKTLLVPCREFIVSLFKSDGYMNTVCGAKLLWYAMVATVLKGLNFNGSHLA